MSFVWLWRTDASSETHLSARAELGPRIGITCQILRAHATFRNYGEVGRKARIVQRLADDLRRILLRFRQSS
jgi:hypothetical protein